MNAPSPSTVTLRPGIIVLAVVTAVIWLAITGGSSIAIGYVDKTVEVILIILLVAEARTNK